MNGGRSPSEVNDARRENQMELTISHWGNSLGLRIPKSIAKMMHLKGGSRIRAVLKERRLILTPLAGASPLKSLAKGINLKSMVAKVTSGNKHILEEESPIGNEIW